LINTYRDTVGEAYVLHRLGQVRARLGRPAEAEELLRKAIARREQMMDSVGAARVQQDLAPILAKRGAVDPERVPT
jgi:hypothetical protein